MAFMFTIRFPRFQSQRSLFAAIGALVSVLWMIIIGQEILYAVSTLATDVLGMPKSIAGLTILALGNTIGDFASNLTSAKLGRPVIAVNSTYGSPIFSTSC